eukprot:2698284-Pyramimonas_sp.AAC.1
MLRTSDDLLDSSLASSGYAHNKQKQVTNFCIARQGAAECKKHIREQGVTGKRMDGIVTEAARYLGP